MDGVRFESAGASLARLPELLQSIPDIIRNPGANPLMATVLLGIALVLALIIVLSIILVLMRPSAEEEALLSHAVASEEDDEEPLSEEEQAELERAETAQRRMASLTVTSLIILVAAVVWVVGGMTTAQSDVCTSCHTDTIHALAKSDDPHGDTKCVDCHEGGGTGARLTVNVVTRVEHVLKANYSEKAAAAFGRPVASDACQRCHHETVQRTFYNPKLRVKVSHKEPIAGGAACVDCHALNNGAVTAATVGMSPCLRCHDGKIAKAECSVCHVGDPSYAIRPSTAVNQMAQAQVPNPTCDGCHTDMSTCDSCHGIKMPHSVDFKMWGHAREGALDIWYNDGKGCVKCHYRGHNDCVQPGCHLTPVAWGHPNPDWAKLHGKAPWLTGTQQGACTCHKWNPYDHDGKTYCQMCHDVKPKGAKP